MKSSQGITIFEILIAIAVLLILFVLLFPAANVGPGEPHFKAQAKNDVVQIATAITAFETEYGHLPPTGNGVVGGEMLSALLGSNSALNPRQIVFIEVMPAKRMKSGFSNGTFVDTFSTPYRIAFADGSNRTVIAGTNNVVVNKRVAVWSDPGQGKTPTEKRRRYVTSWE